MVKLNSKKIEELLINEVKKFCMIYSMSILGGSANKLGATQIIFSTTLYLAFSYLVM